MSALCIYDLIKRYDNGFLALHNVNLSIDYGDFYAILGKNGAGKSTIINIIVSLIKKTSGKIFISGLDLDHNPILIKSLIGVVPQDVNFNQFETVYDIICNQAGFYGLSRSYIFNRVNFLLHLFELWDKRNIISSNLSGGMKRRLMLVRALIHDPDILILDEPTAGVDIFSRKVILDFLIELNKLKKTIILTTHYMDEVETLCNKIAVINKGFVLKELFVKDLHFFNIDKIFIIKVNKVHDLSFLKKFKFSILDKNTIELYLSKNDSLNEFLFFLIVSDVNIFSVTIRNNPLEDFFLNSVIND
ncbi:MAG TPA: ABC transporter ATP-binding protein [Candidatus Azoamicus sp.]